MMAHNPGSEEAVKMGCKCALIDNHYGKGIPTGSGSPIFWVNADCPIHGSYDLEGEKK